MAGYSDAARRAAANARRLKRGVGSGVRKAKKVKAAPGKAKRSAKHKAGAPKRAIKKAATEPFTVKNPKGSPIGFRIKVSGAQAGVKGSVRPATKSYIGYAGMKTKRDAARWDTVHAAHGSHAAMNRLARHSPDDIAHGAHPREIDQARNQAARSGHRPAARRAAEARTHPAAENKPKGKDPFHTSIKPKRPKPKKRPKHPRPPFSTEAKKLTQRRRKRPSSR